MRSPRAARADMKGRNVVNLRRKCGHEGPQCGQLAPHVRTRRAAMWSTCAASAAMKGRNAVTSRRKCGHEKPQCGHLAPHVRTRRAAMLSPRCAGARTYCGSVTTRTVPGSALDITSQPAYISCYKVEDRKTSGFGGCRRYGRAG